MKQGVRINTHILHLELEVAEDVQQHQEDICQQVLVSSRVMENAVGVLALLSVSPINKAEYWPIADSLVFSAASPRAARRRVDHAPLCKNTGQKACPIYSLNWNIGGHRRSSVKYECVNIEFDVE